MATTGQQSTPPPQRPLQKPPGYRDPTVSLSHQPPSLRKPVNLPPSFRPTKRRQKCCRDFSCCRCFCIALSLLLLVFISAGGFLYLWFQPRLPEIHLKSIGFKRFKIKAGPDDGGGPDLLDSECVLGIEIKNPNQNLRVMYHRLRVSLSANIINGDDVNLGKVMVPGFTQDRNEVTNLKVAVRMNKEMVDEDTAGKLKVGLRRRNVPVTAELNGKIGAEGMSGWATATAPVKVVCSGLRLSRRARDSTMPKCRIQILNRFYIS